MNKDNEDLECIVRSNILGVENDGEGIVLVMTGSFNPIIKTHFEMVKIARNHLEERGEKILAVVFVPNRDEVLNCKLGESFNAKFNMKNRIEMMKIARREEGAENWLCIQSFDQFIDFHVVMNKIREKLSKITPEVEVRYLCGTDRVKKVFEILIHFGTFLPFSFDLFADRSWYLEIERVFSGCHCNSTRRIHC
eukprot:TRINITY_DN2687_c0_g1_i2.p1 TRINITY_DN2687_c0_g1~~TRINITY_DN2687_c0_g1_i2.p1  ORF type:complete len:194 (-),score=37.88 TRINITY_DN2687_c0_g1_i2:285-866(-)